MAVRVSSFHRLISTNERWHFLPFIPIVIAFLNEVKKKKNPFQQASLDYLGAGFMQSVPSFVSGKKRNGKQCSVPLGEITNMQLCRLD